MNNTLLHVIEQGRLWDFHGGVHPNENKVQSNQLSIARFSAGQTVVLPIKQHIGKAGELLVSIGDKVLKGQPLTRYTSGLMLPVHASVSGTVTAIEARTIAHPSGLTDMCVVIENDGQDNWTDITPCLDYTSLDQQMLIDKIRSAGVSGLGGAGFPTARKIESGMAKTKALIINAAECEPYITADDTLMREHADDIIKGIEIVTHLLNPELVIIGIEDNKPEAIAALQLAASDTDLVIRVIPTKYPSGGEKQLIEILTGMQVPAKGIPADIGIVMHNVGSMFAIKQAVIDGLPLVERVVTVTGKAFPQPRNYWVPIGTSIRTLVETLDYKNAPKQKLIMGGPMMGFALPHLDVPVSKSTNCILGPTVDELATQEQELACIRCGQCAEVCPARLLPQELQWHAKDSNLEKCEELNINDCIECGACAFVCPSNIPLVHYYRQAKSEIRIQQIEVESAERAKQRFEDRKLRLERDKQEREEKHRKAAEARKKAAEKQGGDDAIAAAIARVKQKQSAPTEEKKPAVAAAIARAKAKQAEALQQQSDTPDNSEMMALREQRKQEAREKRALKDKARAEQLSDDDSKPSPNSAVAAAVARAKARKAAQQSASEGSDTPSSNAKAANPAVAAAVARAKARKAAQSEATSDSETSVEKKESASETKDNKQAAVAAAVARAKARKAAQNETISESDTSAEKKESASETKDNKQAAVAAAVARAKARKAAQSDTTNEPETSAEKKESASETKDNKQAAVAAAVARAKARKAAQNAAEVPKAKPQITESTENDADQKGSKKAAVAAAVARAKARKLANQQKDES